MRLEYTSVSKMPLHSGTLVLWRSSHIQSARIARIVRIAPILSSSTATSSYTTRVFENGSNSKLISVGIPNTVDKVDTVMISHPVISKYSAIYRFEKSSRNFSDYEKDVELDPETRKELQRKANIGTMIEEIKKLVPNILGKSLPKSIISPEISLRICPSHFDEFNAYLPNLKGHVTYYATCKAIQLFMTSVVLSPKVQLHIQQIRVSTSPDPWAVYADTTKIHVRWSTCSEGCFHLSNDLQESVKDDGTNVEENFHSTSAAKLGAHRWSKLDTMKILREQDSPGGISKTLPSITSTLARLPAALIGLTKENKKLERVISGIFIFELNEDNDKIIVHTIENVDVIERFEAEDIDSELRVC